MKLGLESSSDNGSPVESEGVCGPSMDPVEFLVHKLDLSLNILRDLCNVGVYSWPNPWLRKSSRSLSRNIDKLAVTVPGRFILFPKFPWLVTDTCFWRANKYPVKQEIINCLKSRRIIPRPREHSQHITITTLPQISRKKTWSLCDLGAEPIDSDAKCQIFESHKWLQNFRFHLTVWA